MSNLEYILRKAPTLVGADRLMAEVAASTWIGLEWGRRSLGERDVEGRLVRTIAAALVGPRAGEAAVALHALATIAEEPWRGQIDAALSGIRHLPPAWAVDVAKARPERVVRAEKWADPWDSQAVHVLCYDEPAPHALVVAQTTVGGRMVQGISVVARDGVAPTFDGLTRRELAPDEALAEVADALWQTDMYWPPQDEPSYVGLRALVHWRTQGHRPEQGREPITDDERESLEDDFLAGLDLELGSDVVRVLADTFIDFGDGYLTGGALAWNAGEVERFLGDWVHRKVLLDEECTDALPVVLAAWVRFALLRRGLADEHIRPVVEAVFACEEEYRELVETGAAGGPGAMIAARLRDAGVDLGDREAVEAQVKWYNAEVDGRRPRER